MKFPPTAWIIPVHNRRVITLRCLHRLRADGVLSWSRAYVVDDGSTDGTADAVRAQFPEVVLLRGGGDLWWTGATALGMKAAHTDGARLICWLNDDTAPLPGSCGLLCAAADRTGAIVTGQCFMPQKGPMVYGGLKRRGIALRLIHATQGHPQPVDAVCGNFVCIPRAVVDRIGFPDADGLPHAFGDTDYALRARAEGIPVLVEPMANAEAEPNALHNYASWLLSDIPVAEIWRPLARKSSYAYAPAHVRFLARHFGLPGVLYWAWTVFKRVPMSLIRIVVPRAWLIRLWGRHSSAWQEEQTIRSALARSPDTPRE